MKPLAQRNFVTFFEKNLNRDLYYKKIELTYRFMRVRGKSLLYFPTNLFYFLFFPPKTIRKIGLDRPPLQELELKESQVKLWKGNL